MVDLPYFSVRPASQTHTFAHVETPWDINQPFCFRGRPGYIIILQCFHFENLLQWSNTRKFWGLLELAGQCGTVENSGISNRLSAGPPSDGVGACALETTIVVNYYYVSDGGRNLRRSKSMMYLHNIHDTGLGGCRTMTVCAYLVLERTFAEPHKSYPKFPCLINDHRSTACGFCVPSIWLLAHVALVSATGLKRNSQTSSGCCLGWEGSHFLCVLANAGLGVYAQKLYRSHGWCWLWWCIALGATPCLLDNTREIAKNSELLHFSFK